MNKRLIVLLMFLFCGSGKNFFAYAQSIPRGEIINMNYEQKTAFTDLTEGQVEVGDLIEVYNGPQFLLYMKVTETSNLITKLGFIEEHSLTTDEKAFRTIAVGNEVRAFHVEKSAPDAQGMFSRMTDLQEKLSVSQKELKDKEK